jgi:hypothetical protein
MNHPPFAAAHRIKEKRRMRLLDLVRRRQRAHPQLFHAKKPIVIRVKRDQRMIFRR